MGMTHASGCKEAPYDHSGPCKTAEGTDVTTVNLPTPGDPVDHPAHYGGRDDQYEAIKVIEAWKLGFCLGNTVKYIARAGKKDALLQDLKKARWYLDREIANLEKHTSA